MVHDMVSITFVPDGLYYDEAKNRNTKANALDPRYGEIVRHIESLNQQFDDITGRSEDPSSSYDDAEPLMIKLDRVYDEFLNIAKELIREVSACHMLCVACLEAHINMRAEQTIPRASFGEFDRLSLSGKWLFFPKITGSGSFNPGREPFQGFRKLIGRRNTLVHYRTRRDWRKHGYEVPKFVEELGLRAKAASESIATVVGMVTHLAKIEGREVPAWIDCRWWPIFSFSGENS